MHPSQNHSENPDVPTRRVSRIYTIDRFKTQIHYLHDSDLFFTINYQKAPVASELVITRPLDGGEPDMAPYQGDSYYGVVEVLNYIKLQHSEQWNPKVQIPFNWLIFFALSLVELVFGSVV